MIKKRTLTSITYRIYEDQIKTSKRLAKKATELSGIKQTEAEIIRHALDVGFKDYEDKLDN